MYYIICISRSFKTGFEPYERVYSIMNASFHGTLKTSSTLNCLCNMIIYFTFANIAPINSSKLLL